MILKKIKLLCVSIVLSISGPAIATTNCTLSSDVPVDECEALVALYHNTQGTTWFDSPANQWYQTHNPCQWTGIQCKNGHVIAIERQHQNLIGTLPDLAALTQLKKLNLRANRLQGSLATVADLKQLVELALSHNRFAGNLPDLSLLTQLEWFEAAYNQLTGPLPNFNVFTPLRVLNLSNNQLQGTLAAVSKLSQLLVLSLANNQFAGPIPSLDALTQLQALRLSYNRLTGTLPALAPLTQLRVLYLDHNQLNGHIPDLTMLSRLETLHLEYNQFSGPLPALNTLHRLRTLWLAHNQLQGPLPALDTLTQLTHLHLGYNQFTGYLPAFEYLTKLLVLSAESNEFTGNIPPMNALSQLQILQLADNQLQGHLPDLSTLNQLQVINLENNRLTGAIPDLSTLKQLRELRLANNQLNEHIPVSLSQLNALVELDLGYNQLTIPSSQLAAFLSLHDPDWASTQTVAPLDVMTAILSEDEIRVTWSPIAYQTGDGYYQIGYATQSGGPYTFSPLTTTSKRDNAQTIADLSPQTPYYFVVQTHSIHEKNHLVSLLSLETSTQIAHPLPAVSPLITQPSSINPEIQASDEIQAMFTGEIRTTAGAIMNTTHIDAPEKVALVGYIKPAPQHLHQPADIIALYQWSPAQGGETVTLPMTLLQTVDLEEEMAVPLFGEGTLIDLAGVFEISLGYQLTYGEPQMASVIHLTVRPNRPPIHLRLEGNVVKENSPAGTVVGTLVTRDHDRGDWFSYHIVDTQSRNYFSIIDNVLQVTAGFTLDFERGAQHPITIRSIDATGEFIEETFIIQVTDARTVLEDIRLSHQVVLENSPDNLVIGKLYTVSREPGTYHYTLLQDAQGRFEIVDDLLLSTANAQLDYETAITHTIRVQSVNTQTQESLIKTFTIELVNVIDVALEGEISSSAGTSIIPPQFNVREKSILNMKIVPDMLHRGQRADLINVALYTQAEKPEIVNIYQLGQQGWTPWDGNATTLSGIQQVTLADSHTLVLSQSQLANFTRGELNLYAGYRLIETGEVFYSSRAFDIEIIADQSNEAY
jgi:Leucine-rich repeat (LRR) protein